MSFRYKKLLTELLTGLLIRTSLGRERRNGRNYALFVWMMLCFLTLEACRDELPLLRSEGEQVAQPSSGGRFKGMFLLNEGNMGSNKASLDYFDYATGVYQRNIYAERNPEVVKELGDVGNDLEVYGDKLFAVINCSHYVEVMNVYNGKHIAGINIENCRHIVFHDDKAYVSSFAGPVKVDPTARPGKIVEIDLQTLKITREVEVGYQPEEMVIADDRLYVANSGGYMLPTYDCTVSVVDLSSLKVVHTIEVDPNPRGMAIDRQGLIYVSTQGDNEDQNRNIFVIDSRTNQVTGKLGRGANEMCLCGDSLYVLDASFQQNGEEKRKPSFAIYDVVKRQWVSQNFIADGMEQKLQTPYGLAVNPDTREIFLSDATNYVTPGYLYCFTKEGRLQWKVVTGDIPAHMAFTTRPFYPNDVTPPLSPEEPGEEQSSSSITKVLEYCPAPGQFVNLLPAYEEGDTEDTMNQKVLDAIGVGRSGMITLGGYGGYVTVGFDHTIENKAGKCDFRVLGNALGGNGSSGSEPGIIQVACDRNGNGWPDADEWYEIAGSGHKNPELEDWYAMAKQAGNDVHLYRDYRIAYEKPAKEPVTADDRLHYIHWTDNQGKEGYRTMNAAHLQPYYPQWIATSRLTFRGTCLPQNSVNIGQNGQILFSLYAFRYGYADNAVNGTVGTEIDIDWAVDEAGQPARLTGVDFVRIYTGINQENGWLGECSTEVCGIEDLHSSADSR
ncbi:lipoprotein [gut metagenome]|uniref:Lipoprotein n=1 Tax=gut metagenome TaxID=749906 RepID=J9CQ47_9ZZZZ